MTRIDEIRARSEAATPGPWMWDIRTATRQVKLVTDHSGQYYVMDFVRWGMQDACPTFQVYQNYGGPVTERGSKGMVRADKLAKSYPGKEHHKGFDDYINHPDAIFIAHARADIPFLIDKIAAMQIELDKCKGSCEYTIHTPSEEGYPDVAGKYYECSCGANYIDIEVAQEWRYCPHCGKSISSFETLTCISCKSAEWDGDSYYCEAKDGEFTGENVDHANFDGCKCYAPRETGEAASIAQERVGDS